MQSQMIGMQSSLDRILSAVQPQGTGSLSMPPPPPGMYPLHMEGHRDGTGLPPQHRNGFEQGPAPSDRGRFPPLPGFAPPVRNAFQLLELKTYRISFQPHKYAPYGIVPSTAPSSDDESEDTLPRVSLNAPIEALQGLANAAAEAAAAPSADPPRCLFSITSHKLTSSHSRFQSQEAQTGRTYSK